MLVVQIAGVLVLAFGLLLAFGARRWRDATSALMQRLDAATMPQPGQRYSERQLDGLPAPVQRYFRAVMQEGAPVVASATLAQQGNLNMGEAGDRWLAFTSRQRVVTRRPGFVWDARVMLAPGLAIRVHDAYVAGEGRLRAALLGLFTLAKLRGRDEMARGELMRYLAEAAWYPTALLPGQGVSWQAIDDTSARATLSDGDAEASLIFRFGADSLIETVYADARGRTVAGQIVPTPWEGRWADYRLQAGMLVPTSGEVSWLLPQGRKPYWRGVLTSVSYGLAA